MKDRVYAISVTTHDARNYFDAVQIQKMFNQMDLAAEIKKRASFCLQTGVNHFEQLLKIKKIFFVIDLVLISFFNRWVQYFETLYNHRHHNLGGITSTKIFFRHKTIIMSEGLFSDPNDGAGGLSSTDGRVNHSNNKINFFDDCTLI